VPSKSYSCFIIIRHRTSLSAPSANAAHAVDMRQRSLSVRCQTTQLRSRVFASGRFRRAARPLTLLQAQWNPREKRNVNAAATHPHSVHWILPSTWMAQREHHSYPRSVSAVRCSTTLTRATNCDETEPQQGLHAPEQRLGRSSTWIRQ